MRLVERDPRGICLVTGDIPENVSSAYGTTRIGTFPACAFWENTDGLITYLLKAVTSVPSPYRGFGLGSNNTVSVADKILKSPNIGVYHDNYGKVSRPFSIVNFGPDVPREQLQPIFVPADKCDYISERFFQGFGDTSQLLGEPPCWVREQVAYAMYASLQMGQPA